MNLKLRYALFLLLVAALLTGVSAAAVYLLYTGRLTVMFVLLALLYATTYVLGKRFSTVFFTLSFLRLLRQNNGSISLDGYECFMDRSLGKRRTADYRTAIKREVLQKLEQEKIILLSGNRITLLLP